MLPTTGFFKNIECPYHESNCDRPYCHFRHRKKYTSKETRNESSTGLAPMISSDMPTYNPTPKSQLASTRNTHIPISYVPDLAVLPRERPFRYNNKPIYNPTPLSVLSSNKDIQDSNTHPSDVPKYDPNDTSPNVEINFEDLSSEFDMIDKLIVESSTELNNASNLNGSNAHEINNKSEVDCDNLNEKNNEKCSDNKNDLQIKSKREDNVKKKEKSKENNTELKHKEDKHKKNSSKKHKDSETDSDTHSKTAKTIKPESKHQNSDTKNKKSSTTKTHSLKNSSSTKTAESGDDTKCKTETKSSSRNRSVDTEKGNHSKTRRKSSGHESDHVKHKSKHNDKSSKRHKTSKHKDSLTSSKGKTKKEHSLDKSRSKYESKHKEKSSKRTSSERDHHKNKEKPIKIETEKIEVSVEEILSESSDNDEQTMEECLKIFSEYKPTEPQIFLQSRQDIINDEETNVTSVCNNKKRIAHDTATHSKLTFTKPKASPTPAQVMMNRFKTIARFNPEVDEQGEIMAEVNSHVSKRPQETDINPIIKKPRIVEQKSTSIVDDIINGRTPSTQKRRIAPVLNAGLIQKAKAQIDAMNKAKSASVAKTQVQTVLKGAKRVAHVSEQCVLDIPDVLAIERSKLPVNVRSRFLQMMVEECRKLYYIQEEAHQRALQEELKCYERCAVLTTYRNSAMLAINRLRKERQEREAAGLDLIFPGDETNNTQDLSNPLHGQKFYNNIAELALSEEELILHGFPRESTTPGHALIKQLRNKPQLHNTTENDRTCSRCAKHYQVNDDGFVLYEEECIYHPLKKRTFRGESIYLCCKSSDDSGCVTSNTHVSDALINENEGYQMTMPPNNDSDPRSYCVYALDCEMCYTTRGLELTRVTIVNPECKTVYETLVKPMNPIIDYNTRFSGITKEQMERTATSILQVQANILHLCNSKTILIGHSLESDMKALKIIHNTIIDTSVLFPHKFGLPHKRALRDLAREYLKKIIQNDVNGHDSAEDALSCMELVQWKVKEDCKTHGIKI